MSQERIRVLIGKPGLDGHDRGAKVVARALRDAGMEVIYTGLHRSPEEIVETAIQEDVDAIGLSILSGAHMTLFPRVLDLLKEKGAADIILFGGGVIPDEDREALLKRGVAEIFIPGGATQRTIDFLQRRFAEKAGAAAKAKRK
ncbi:MAG: methylmalonyl-CoA mutase [Candidatus Melainabacteria bacterium]|nr:MAG: methylmalonyl-CoA mutase [Candidatus Melainabacteria bacterium]